MNIYLLALVIFVTFVMVPLAVAWWMGRDPAPLPGELPIAGYFDLPGTLARYAAPTARWAYCRKDMHLLHPIGECPYDPPDEPYGPFPADTGPLLILSEKTAANAALEREIPRLCAEAEAKIPPRWR